MRLNPYQFKRFLRTSTLKPHWTGWAVVFIAAIGWMMAAFPYMAPAAVAIHLPRAAASTQPDYAAGGTSAIIQGSSVIFQGELLRAPAFIKRLGQSTDKTRLLLIASADTTLAEVLPLMTAAQNSGFANVSFVIKP